MRTFLAILIAAGIAAGASSARADEATDDSKRILVAAKVGGIVPLDGLSPAPSFGIEGGYVLRPVVIVLAVDYTQPTTTGSEMDPRVEGGRYTWKLTEQTLAIMPAVHYRQRLAKLTAYGGVGVRVLLMRSHVRDDGAPIISETTEQSTEVAVGVPVGAEMKLGPGSALGELLIQYGGLDHTATGDSHTGGVSLSVGYRFGF